MARTTGIEALAGLPGWPLMLTEPQAAAYVALPLDTFRSAVQAGDVPKPRELRGARLWNRQQIDRHLNDPATAEADQAHRCARAVEPEMPVKLRYINAVTSRAKTYYYCRLTGVALPSPADETAFLAAVLAARDHLDPNPTPATVRVARAVARATSIPAGTDRSFRRLVVEYKATDEYTGLATRTRSEYDRHIARLIDALGGYQVAAIQPAHVKTLMRKFSGSLTVGKAVKRTLSAILSFAVNELGWITTNPAFGLERKPRRKRRTEDQHGDRVEAAQRPLEEVEIARVRRTSPIGTRRRAIVESLLGTGFRRGDSRRMPGDLGDRNVVPLITNKSGQLVVAPVTAEMKRAALGWNRTRADAGHQPSEYLVCSEKGTPLHERTVSKEVAAAFAAAGMPNRGAHCLRYTAAVRLLELGFAYEDIAEHLGHSTARMAREYCRMRRAAELKGRLLNDVDDALISLGGTAC